MKRKYYMRGLGFGILLTTLVFVFLNSGEPTDEEVIKRAEELGYMLPEPSDTPGLDLDELKDKTPVPTKTPAATLPPSNTPEPTPTLEPTKAPTPVPTAEPTATKAPQETLTSTPEPTKEPTPVMTVTSTPVPTVEPTKEPTMTPEPTVAVVKAQITVVKGNTASKVCRMIEEAGIVEDWEDLRDYLKSRDLVNEINVGTFTLSSDMSLEEIAKIITGK